MTSSVLRRAVVVGSVALAALVGGACNEHLDSGAACPSLCPGLSVPIKDTTLSPVLAWDTTLVGFPSIGTESGLPLASRGDTLDVRGIIRFDSLTRVFTPTSDTSADTLTNVTRVDTAILRMRLNLTGSRLPAWVRFEVYDVDTTADDNDVAAVLKTFRQDRFVVSRTLQRAEITDSLVFALPSAWLLNKITTGAAARVGLRLVGAGPVSLMVHTTETGLPAEIRYYVSADTSVHQVIINPYSKTPTEPASLANDYRDYIAVARNTLPALGAQTFSTGGMPARRSYLKFNIPQWMLDSTTIVRATLQLTQAPQRGFDAADTVVVFGQAVGAAERITDLTRSAQILLTQGLFVTDSIRVAPADSGVRTLEMNSLIGVWKASDTSSVRPQRAVVLLQREEGLHGAEVRFFNAKAPAAVRPRLRVSYIPKITFGAP